MTFEQALAQSKTTGNWESDFALGWQARDEEVKVLQARIERVRALAEKIPALMTAWLKRNGVPISMEFVNFANGLGDLLDALEEKE